MYSKIVVFHLLNTALNLQNLNTGLDMRKNQRYYSKFCLDTIHVPVHLLNLQQNDSITAGYVINGAKCTKTLC